MNVVQLAGRQSKNTNTLSRPSVVAALDIGSSKISCVIAEAAGTRSKSFPDTRQTLRVLGFGQTATRGVRAGAITDINQAESAIRLAVDAAERMAQTSISEVVVVLSGGKPTSISLRGTTKTQTGIVGPADLEAAVAAALSDVSMERRTLVHLHPINNTLDGFGDIEKPLGMHGDDLQVDVGLTSLDTSYLRNISQAVARAHLDVSDFIIAPYAAAKAALTVDEQAMGTLVIDMGGAVTSLAFVKNSKLISAASTMLGGQHVTNDIAQGLSTSVSHAERMKTLFGSAIEGGHGDREMLAVPLLGERGTEAVHHIPRAHLASIMRARLEEIFEHCNAILATGAFARAASARVVLTGGASQSSGLRDLASYVLQRTVRLGSVTALTNLPEAQRSGSFAAVIGALVHAANPEVKYALPQQSKANFERAQMGYAKRFGRWLAEAL